MAVSNAAVIDARRAMVAQLSLKGLSQREIVKALKQQRIVNPRSGKPWSLGTINKDLEILETEWQEAALAARAERKARLAAELELLKRTAWRERDYKLVAELLKQERAMFGLDEPIDINMNGRLDVEHSLSENPYHAVADMPEDELDQLIVNLLEANGIPVDAPAIFEGEYKKVEEE